MFKENLYSFAKCRQILASSVLVLGVAALSIVSGLKVSALEWDPDLGSDDETKPNLAIEMSTDGDDIRDLTLKYPITEGSSASLKITNGGTDVLTFIDSIPEGGDVTLNPDNPTYSLQTSSGALAVLDEQWLQDGQRRALFIKAKFLKDGIYNYEITSPGGSSSGKFSVGGDGGGSEFDLKTDSELLSPTQMKITSIWYGDPSKANYINWRVYRDLNGDLKFTDDERVSIDNITFNDDYTQASWILQGSGDYVFPAYQVDVTTSDVWEEGAILLPGHIAVTPSIPEDFPDVDIINYGQYKAMYAGDYFRINFDVQCDTSYTVSYKLSKLSNYQDGPVVSDDDYINHDSVYNQLGKKGGSIQLNEEGVYILTADFVSTDGLSSTVTVGIAVYVPPTAVIVNDSESGSWNFRLGQQIGISSGGSYEHGDYPFWLHKIDHTQDRLQVIPMDGQSSKAIHVMDIPVENEVPGSSYKGGLLFNKYQMSGHEGSPIGDYRAIGFSEPGRYKLILTVFNEAGKSGSVEQIVNIADATTPVLQATVPGIFYRDVDDSNLATIALSGPFSDVLNRAAVTATSQDGSSFEDLKIDVVYDANNNGVYGDSVDLSFSSYEGSNLGTRMGDLGDLGLKIETIRESAGARYWDVSFKTGLLGKYKITLNCDKKPAEDTLPGIEDSTSATNAVVLYTEVGNTAPSALYHKNPYSKVDVVFALGKVSNDAEYKAQTSALESLLNASGNYIDAEVAEIKTIDVSFSDSSKWLFYVANQPHRGTGYINSGVEEEGCPPGYVNASGNSIRFGGYGSTAYYDYGMYQTTLMEKLTISFTVTAEKFDTHTLSHAGFNFACPAGNSRGGYSIAMDHSSFYLKNNRTGQRLWSTSRREGAAYTVKIISDPKNNNIQVFVNGGLVSTINAPVYGPQFGPYCQYSRHSCPSQSIVSFSNIQMQYDTTKSLGESLGDVTWRDNSYRFIVHISDTVPEEMKDFNSTDFRYSLAKVLASDAYVANVGTSTSEAALKQFGTYIVSPSGESKSEYFNKVATSEVIKQISDWIISIVKQNTIPSDFILVGTRVGWETTYKDDNNDIKFRETSGFDQGNILQSTKWRFRHYERYFDNSNVKEPYHDVWMVNPVEVFYRPGQFRINYKEKDNPIAPDANIDAALNQYRLWSTDYDPHVSSDSEDGAESLDPGQTSGARYSQFVTPVIDSAIQDAIDEASVIADVRDGKMLQQSGEMLNTNTSTGLNGIPAGELAYTSSSIALEDIGVPLAKSEDTYTAKTEVTESIENVEETLDRVNSTVDSMDVDPELEEAVDGFVDGSKGLLDYLKDKCKDFGVDFEKMFESITEFFEDLVDSTVKGVEDALRNIAVEAHAAQPEYLTNVKVSALRDEYGFRLDFDPTTLDLVIELPSEDGFLEIPIKKGSTSAVLHESDFGMSYINKDLFKINLDGWQVTRNGAKLRVTCTKKYVFTDDAYILVREPYAATGTSTYEAIPDGQQILIPNVTGPWGTDFVINKKTVIESIDQTGDFTVDLSVNDLRWPPNLYVRWWGPGYNGDLVRLDYDLTDIFGSKAEDDKIEISEGTVGYLEVMANDTFDTRYDVPAIVKVEVLSGEGTAEPIALENITGTDADGKTNPWYIKYTPPEGYFGKVKLKYTYEPVRSDLPAMSANVDLTVKPINDPPIANTVPRTATAGIELDVDGKYHIPVDILLRYVEDPDTPAIALRINGVERCSGGTVELQGNEVVLTPAPGFYGLCTFYYKANDGELDSFWADAYIDIGRVITKPVAKDDEFNVKIINGTVPLDVASNDLASGHDNLVIPSFSPVLLNGVTTTAVRLNAVSDGDSPFIELEFIDSTQFAAGDVLKFTYNLAAVDNILDTSTATVLVHLEAPDSAEDNEGYMYVHRRPLASYKPVLTKNGSQITSVTIPDGNELSKDLDHSQTHAEWSESRAYSWKGLSAWEWAIKTGTGNWTTKVFAMEDYTGSAKDARAAGIAWINSELVKMSEQDKFNSDAVYVQLRVRDIDGENNIGVWSAPYVNMVTYGDLPPIAYFAPSNSVFWYDPNNPEDFASNFNIDDMSYSPVGYNLKTWTWEYTNNRNASYSIVSNDVNNPSKSIVDKIIADIQGIFKSGYANKNPEFRVKLTVVDDHGKKSEPYIVTFKVFYQNQPPEFQVPDNSQTGSIDSSTLYEIDDGADGVVGDDYGTLGNTTKKGTIDFANLVKVSDDQINTVKLSWDFSGQSVSKRTNYRDAAAPSIQKTWGDKKPGEVLFSDTVTDQGFAPGAYKLTVVATDNPDPSIYGENQNMTSVWQTKAAEKPYHFYVVPKIYSDPHYKFKDWIDGKYNEKTGQTVEEAGLEPEDVAPVIGETVELYLDCNQYVTGITGFYDYNRNGVMDGEYEQEFELESKDINDDGTIRWKYDYLFEEVPDPENEDDILTRCPFIFTVTTNWGSETGEVMRTKIRNMDVMVLPVKLYDFNVQYITDPDVSEYLTPYIKEDTHRNELGGVPAGDLAVDNSVITTGVRKGYSFYFEIWSKGLQKDNDFVRVIPHFFAVSQDETGATKIGSELTGYLQNQDKSYSSFQVTDNEYFNTTYAVFYEGERQNLLGSQAQLDLPISLRTQIGTEQIWKGRYGIPAGARFAPVGVALTDESEYKGDILVTFEFHGMKKGEDRYDYIAKKQWKKEREEYPNGAKSIYSTQEDAWRDSGVNVGSVIIYNALKSVDDEYNTAPVWDE